MSVVLQCRGHYVKIRLVELHVLPAFPLVVVRNVEAKIRNHCSGCCWLRMRACMHSHVSHFVGDRERGGQAIVLDYGTALLSVAHRSQFGQAQGVAFVTSSEIQPRIGSFSFFLYKLLSSNRWQIIFWHFKKLLHHNKLYFLISISSSP